MRCSLEKVFTAETCCGRTDRENAQNHFFLSGRAAEGSAGRVGPGRAVLLISGAALGPCGFLPLGPYALQP